MHQELKRVLREMDFTGVVTVDEGPDRVLTITGGCRDRSNRSPNESDTFFGIASGTKTFTAAGILCLVDNGAVSLETPVVDILGEVSYIHSGATVRQLLNHTSGTFDYYDEETVEDFNNYTVAIPWFRLETPSDYLPLFENRKPKYTPGDRVSYSNGAYVLLGVIIEKVTGRTYRDFLENEVLRIAGMKASGFHAFNDLPANTAWGYMPLNGTEVTNIYQLPIRGGGDGGLYTNAPEMHMFWNSLFGGEILSADSFRAMTGIEVRFTGGTAYGLGLYHSEFHGDPAFASYGGDGGVGFASMHVPQRHLTVSVFSNRTDGERGVLKLVLDSVS